jgi:hypothetical protein
MNYFEQALRGKLSAIKLLKRMFKIVSEAGVQFFRTGLGYLLETVLSKRFVSASAIECESQGMEDE